MFSSPDSSWPWSLGWALASLLLMTWAARALDWVWWRPRRLERALRAQGLRGTPYRLYFGDLKELTRLGKEARSEPLAPLSHDIAPRVATFFHRAVKERGKVSFAWLGPSPRVIIADPDLVKEVLLNKFGHFRRPNLNPLSRMIVTGLLSYDGEQWVKHRRILNPAFHMEKIKRMTPAFATYSAELIERWKGLTGAQGNCEVDVWPEFQNLTGDVISRTAFGSNFLEGRKIFQLQTEQAMLLMQAFQKVYIPGYRFLPTALNKRIYKIDREIKILLRGIIEKREKEIKIGKACGDDLLGLLMESNRRQFEEHGNKNAGMTIDEVIEECKLFYFAGQETTSILLTWTLIALSMHPIWQIRAREEILQIFGKNTPDSDGLSRLKIWLNSTAMVPPRSLLLSPLPSPLSPFFPTSLVPLVSDPTARVFPPVCFSPRRRRPASCPLLATSASIRVSPSSSSCIVFVESLKIFTKAHFFEFFDFFPPGAAIVAEAILDSSQGEEEAGDSEGSQEEEFKFVEVGYISSPHGLGGEVRVVPSTDFPELRFSEPGTRWLRMRVSGKEQITEMELISGRDHPGQKSWIVSFSGIDTVDKAKQLVGSTILVMEEDRPYLEEGEFYTADLIGMRVLLKDTGRIVGTVANVFNHGAGDLLQVMLDANGDGEGPSDSSKGDKMSSGQHIWIPFVEAIVPDVDMENGEMWITPPKGLLELNVRSDTRSKKERRVLEWRERKKLQQRFSAAKKKLAEIGQTHILDGLDFGDKEQKNLLRRQIADIDLNLFQHALQSINEPIFSFSENIHIHSSTLSRGLNTVSQHYLINCVNEGTEDLNYKKLKVGRQLLKESKVAIVLIVTADTNRLEKDSETILTGSDALLNQFQELLFGCDRYLKVDDQKQMVNVPLIVVSPTHQVQSYKDLLSNNNYFGFDGEKVWVLGEVELPVITASKIETNKILLKSPWELNQAPIGSGGLFSLLEHHKVVHSLNDMGIEYMQVCSLDNRCILGHPLFFGLVHSAGADIGVKGFGVNRRENEFDMIFSMKYVNTAAKQVKIQIRAAQEQHVHMERIEKEWVTVRPDEPNSYRFYSSIYCFLDTCSPDSTCILEVTG